MMALSFCKLIPGGNSTILLTDTRFAPEELARVSEKLMHPMHLQAEQVGALFTNNAIPHLQMMGGEFCVNATRSAALMLCRMGKLKPCMHDCLLGEITVSGMAEAVEVLVAKSAGALQNALERKIHHSECGPQTNADGEAQHDQKENFTAKTSHGHCAARIACGSGCTRVIDLDEGVCLVHLPGISHLLLDATRFPMPENWQKSAAQWRQKTGLSTAPASGVVWYENTEETCRIWPAVEVRATKSEHMETACGSASLAMALMLHGKKVDQYEKGPDKALPTLPRKHPMKQTTPLEVTQPSGESLSVLLDFSCNVGGDARLPARAWVFGPVFIAGEGTAYIAL